MLSAILYLGNVTYKKAAGRDEGLEVGPPEVLDILSQLLKVSWFLFFELTWSPGREGGGFKPNTGSVFPRDKCQG